MGRAGLVTTFSDLKGSLLRVQVGGISVLPVANGWHLSIYYLVNFSWRLLFCYDNYDFDCYKYRLG